MPSKIFYVLIALVALSGCAHNLPLNREVPPASCMTTGDYHPGGNLPNILEQVSRERATGKKKEIRGYYASSAIAYLAWGGERGDNLCISPIACFGVHEARHGKYEEGVRSELWTAILHQYIPRCTQSLFDSENAFSSGKGTFFTGAEVLKICQFKACS
ncbi:hypothetical protein K8Q93_00590 [Candidatus Parcubacteria bacterium]|nr:hypothetical protein [Candidatus Parcubacteria bacterium]